MPNLILKSLCIITAITLAGCNPFTKIRSKHKALPREVVQVATPAFSISVQPQYQNAANWAQYVKRSDLTSTCDGSETGYSPCVHGGDKKKVVITGVSSCSGLSMTDSASAFNWICDDSSQTATFYSVLKLDKTLGDLVTASAWKNLTVTLHGGAHNGTTSSGLVAWWSNTVVEAPINHTSCTPVNDFVTCETSGRAKLIHAGAVYVVSSNRQTLGYKISADNVSFTTLPGVVLKTKLVANCTYQNDEIAGPFPETCFLQTYSNKFLWVEGKFSMSQDPVGNSSDVFGVYIKDTKLSTFRHIDSAVSDDAAIVVDSSSSNNFSYIKASSASTGLRVTDLPFSAGATENNVFSQVFINGTSSNGIAIQDATNSIFTTMTIANTDGGINHNANTNHIVYHNLLLANNKTSGLAANNSNNLTIDQTGSFYTDYGLSLDTITNSTVTGNFIFGNNATANCSITGAAPFVSAACTNNASNNTTNPPDAIVTTSIDVSTSFMGQISSVNFPLVSDWILTDWITPENFFYSWNKTGTFLARATSGYCDSAETDCHVYDYSLALTDTALLGKSDDGVTMNDAFAIGSNCPAAVEGNKILKNSDATITYLKNAIEIDGSGNGNGLCESGETCLYTPNIGAYQGHGHFGKCIFTNGTISNVVMSGYESNGY